MAFTSTPRGLRSPDHIDEQRCHSESASDSCCKRKLFPVRSDWELILFQLQTTAEDALSQSGLFLLAVWSATATRRHPTAGDRDATADTCIAKRRCPQRRRRCATNNGHENERRTTGSAGRDGAVHKAVAMETCPERPAERTELEMYQERLAKLHF